MFPKHSVTTNKGTPEAICNSITDKGINSTLIDRRDAGDRQRRKMTAPGDSNSLMVQNLRPGTRYKFRVAAENRHGISQESQAVTTRMLDEGSYLFDKLSLQ